MKRLPPLFGLRALEAAVRHQSYSRAGEELAVTHGAISQQIRRLEDELGAKLFERRGNAMMPTADVQRLAAGLRRGLDLLHEAMEGFGRAADHGPLVISLDGQFATRWLPKRLPRLLGSPAGQNLELRVEDRCADFVTDGVDLSVRNGEGPWEGVESVQLIRETLFPVCAPHLARRHGLRRPADLLHAPLLQHGHRPWSLWFDAFGLRTPAQTGVLFEDSLMLYEAAAQGLGVALARSSLVEPDLTAGRLVAPTGQQIPSERGYFLVWRADSRKLGRIQALRDWLLAEASVQPGAANLDDCCAA